MPEQYQSVLGNLVQGMLQGRELASRIKHEKLQEEAYVRSAAREEREAGIQEIMHNMEMRDRGGRQIQNGMIEETGPGSTTQALDLGGGVSLPGTPVPGGTYLRKARGADSFKIKGPTGETSWELPTAEEQITRTAQRAQQAKYNEIFGTARASEDVVQQMGIALPDEMADFVGMPRGSKVMRDKLPELLSKAEAAKKARQVSVPSGGKIIDSVTGKVIAENEAKPSRPAGLMEQDEFKSRYFGAKKIDPATATDEQHLQAGAAFQAMKTAGADTRADRTATETARHNKAMEERMARMATAGLNTLQNTKVNQIANNFDNEAIVKRYNIQAEAKAFVDTLGTGAAATPGDDQALLYGFAKVNDPDSVVREGEYATVQKYSQSWASTFGFKADRIFSNAPFLTDEARKVMKDTISKRVAAAKTSYDNVYNEYGRRIEKQAGVKAGSTYLTNYGQAHGGGKGAQADPLGIR